MLFRYEHRFLFLAGCALLAGLSGCAAQEAGDDVALLSPTDDHGASTQVGFASLRFVAASPANYASRRRPKRCVVIHVAEGTAASTVQWFQNPSARVSAHYVVDAQGNVTQMLENDVEGWHAGVRQFNEDCIGIEHEGWVQPAERAAQYFTCAMYAASATLVRRLAVHETEMTLAFNSGTYFDLPYRGSDFRGLVGHSQINRDKQDPGPHWDWNVYMGLVGSDGPPSVSDCLRAQR